MLTLRSNPYTIREKSLKVFVDQAGKQIFVDGFDDGHGLIDGILFRGSSGSRFNLIGNKIFIIYGNGQSKFELGEISNVSEAERWVEEANAILS